MGLLDEKHRSVEGPIKIGPLEFLIIELIYTEPLKIHQFQHYSLIQGVHIPRIPVDT